MIASFSADPKGNDDQDFGGEWFLAWLRQVHREVYDDIDRSDPSKILQRQWMASESREGRKRRHQVGDVKIPTCQAAFTEILEGFKHDEAPTRRMSVLAQIFIDVWMLRLVDYAAVLKALDVVACSSSARVVVVCYFGSAHARAVEHCFRFLGLTPRGLSAEGLVGKPDHEDDECRALDLPSYLRNLRELFPVPT